MKKLTYEFVESEFKKANYELISKTYINANEYLEYKCHRSHSGKMSWANFSQGYRCGKCFGNSKLSIDFIKKEFEAVGYKLLSSNYVNANTFLDYECNFQHHHKISWAKFKRGQRCGKCFGNTKLSIDFIKKEFEAVGYKLLSSDYINANAFLEYECSQQHRHRISWSHFSAGHRCGKCYALTRNGKNFYQSGNIKRRTREKSNLDPVIFDNIFDEILEEIGSFYDRCEAGFNIDHIIPFTFFNHNNEDEIRACWSLNNLRYIPVSENISRGNYLSHTEFTTLTPSQLEILQIASLKPKKINICLNDPDPRKRKFFTDMWRNYDDRNKKFY